MQGARDLGDPKINTPRIVEKSIDEIEKPWLLARYYVRIFLTQLAFVRFHRSVLPLLHLK
jgi:hypothetical protein